MILLHFGQIKSFCNDMNKGEFAGNFVSYPQKGHLIVSIYIL